MYFDKRKIYNNNDTLILKISSKLKYILIFYYIILNTYN